MNQFQHFTLFLLQSLMDVCVPVDPGETPPPAKQMIQIITYLNHAVPPPLFSFFHCQIFADEKHD